MATATLPKQFNYEDAKRKVGHPLQRVRAYIRQYIVLEGLALVLLAASLVFWIGLTLDFGLMLIDFDLIKVYGIDWILELNELDQSGIASLGFRIIVLT